MKSNKIKISVLAVLIVSISILLGIVACKTQPNPSQPMSPSLTQVSPTMFTAPPTPTHPPLSNAELANFFGDTSCLWPCWQGITPGITSGAEAIQKLNDSPLVLKNSIHIEEPRTGFGDAKWYWKISDKQALEGNMEWRNGIVLFNALTPPMISIEEIINRFGPPEKIDVINCALTVEGPQTWCATLYYAKNGFEIHYNRDSSGFGDDIQMMPSDSINFVSLFKPSAIEDWLLSMGSDPTYHDLRDWKGYGKFLDLYYYRQ
jgi:hypothetical protein